MRRPPKGLSGLHEQLVRDMYCDLIYCALFVSTDNEPRSESIPVFRSQKHRLDIVQRHSVRERDKF